MAGGFVFDVEEPGAAAHDGAAPPPTTPAAQPPAGGGGRVFARVAPFGLTTSPDGFAELGDAAAWACATDVEERVEGEGGGGGEGQAGDA